MGSSENDSFDQQLEHFDVPIDSICQNKFNICVTAPDLSKLPSAEEVFDSTALCIIVKYDDREFFRCSFLISHNYNDGLPRDQFTLDGLYRYVLLDRGTST